MLRCPHCAAPLSNGDLCVVCGLPQNVPAPRDEILAGLVTTHEPLPEVPVEVLPGLVTTVEALGDVTIPDDEAATGTGDPSRDARVSAELPVRCRACGVNNPPGRVACVACGVRF